MVLRDKGQVSYYGYAIANVHCLQIMLNEFLLDLFEASAYQLARPPVLVSRLHVHVHTCAHTHTHTPNDGQLTVEQTSVWINGLGVQ